MKLLQEAGIQQEAEHILLLTQYFDTLSEVSKNSETKTLLLPSNPGGFNNFTEELRNTLFAGNNINQ